MTFRFIYVFQSLGTETEDKNCKVTLHHGYPLILVYSINTNFYKTTMIYIPLIELKYKRINIKK